MPSEGRNNISFTVDNEDFERAVELGDVLRAELGALKLETERDIAKLSIVGVGMKSHSGVAGRAFGALARSGINIKSVSTSEICIACLIDSAEAEKAAKAVHEEFELGKTPAPATS